MDSLRIIQKPSNSSLSFSRTDNDNEMEVSMHDSEENTLGIIWIDENDAIEIIQHLKNQFQI